MKYMSAITLLLLLMFNPIKAQAGCYYEYDLPPNDTEILGILHTVDFQTAPYTQICGQWYENGQVALAPNVDIPQSWYCRTTDENGETFFAYRYRGSVDCDLAASTLEFRTF